MLENNTPLKSLLSYNYHDKLNKSRIKQSIEKLIANKL